MADDAQRTSTARRRFRVIETIGKGGFGTVYRAEMSDAGGFSKQVALKVMTYDGEASDEIARRMRDEARILGLIRHRAVVGVNSLVPLAEGWGVVMEYVAGIDLSTAIKKQRPPPGVVLEVIEEVSAALNAAYTRAVGDDGRPLRLIHRDIKPSNIRITGTGVVKLLDFGVARAEFERKEAVEYHGLVMGSGRYMAPERRKGAESHQADVYALGIVLANALSGKRFAEPPEDPDEHARYLGTVLETVRKALERHNDDQVRAASHDLRMLLLEMLAFHREDRPDADKVEKRCRRIRKRLPGPWLRDWAERTVSRLQEHQRVAPSDDADDTGLVFEEKVADRSGGQPRARPAPGRAGGSELRSRLLVAAAMLGSGLIGFVLGRVL